MTLLNCPGLLPFPYCGWHRLPSQPDTDVPGDPPVILSQPVPSECSLCPELPIPLPSLLPCSQGCLTVFQATLTSRDCLSSNGISVLISIN